MTAQDERPAYATGRCYRHPDRATNIACSRCERPICPDCMNAAPVGFQCPSCVRQLRGRAPTRPYGGAVSQRSGIAAVPVTAVLVAFNVVIFVITAAQSGRGINNNQYSSLYQKFVLVPDYTAAHHQFGRLVGSAFLHFGLAHIFVNMFSLILIGPALERIFGWQRYLALYLVSALGASVAVYLFSSPGVGTVGASGAIFGLFGAFFAVFRRLGLDMRALVPTIVINVILNLTISNLSWQGHLGGAVVGAVLSWAFVYAPRQHRNLVQAAAVIALLALFVLLTAWRTGVLNG